MIRFYRHLVLLALIAPACGYETAVPFPHDGGAEAAAAVIPPDSSLAPDAGAAPQEDAPGLEADASVDIATPTPDGAQVADLAPTSAACTSCYQQAIAKGTCKAAKPGGCEDIPAEGLGMDPGRNPGDRALCQALDDCLKRTGCWTGDTGLLGCFCGTAANFACISGSTANGACKAEFMAATRATNDMQANMLLYNTNLPSGFAAQKYACYKTSCPDECK
jgi:hypothetical protein